MASSFDPGAAITQGQGQAFSGIYTTGLPGQDSGPKGPHVGDLGLAGNTGLNAPAGAVRLTDPAAYEKALFTQIADDPEQIKQLQQQLKDAGYSVSVTGLLDAQTDQAYTALLTDIAVATQSGQVITPEQYLAQKIAANGGPGGGANTTESSTSFTAPTDARAAAIQAFTSALGRRPTQHQLDAFYQALHAYEAANPTVTSQSKAGSDYSTTTSGGPGSVGSFADQYVAQNFGAEAGNTSALHFFGLAANSLAGPPGGTHEVV
jgi:hypothetical protein